MTDPYVEVDQGLVPFLIDWGDTPHPGDSAPQGVSIVDLKAWHPAPGKVSDKLSRLGIDLRIEPAAVPKLVAELDSPAGRVTLS